MTKYIEAEKFQTQCLKLTEQVHRTKKRIIITKGKKPIAQLIPFKKKKESLFGKMKGTIHILEDIIPPIDSIWNVSH